MQHHQAVALAVMDRHQHEHAQFLRHIIHTIAAMIVMAAVALAHLEAGIF